MELDLDYLTRLKTIELDMLKSFVGVCEKLGLEWFAIGGTLLGAVRHQGFIPWDDDIDIGMKRKDYNRFVKEGGRLLGEGLFLQTKETDPDFCLGFAKIRNSGTTFIESSLSKLDINHGVYIDIFPLDYYPTKRLAQKWMRFRTLLVYTYISQKRFVLERKPSFKGRVACLLSQLIFGTVANAVDARDRFYQKTAESDLLVNHFGIWGKREIVPASYFDSSRTMKFEDMEIKAPVEFDNYLKCIYGDYMKLPPLEERAPHHFTDLIDLDRPYTEYTRDTRRSAR